MLHVQAKWQTMDIFLYYDVADVMWSAIFTRFSLSWVMPRRVFDLYGCWWTSGRLRSVAIWKMVPTCILWCVWTERNNRYFEDLERFLEDSLAFRFLFFFSPILGIIFGQWLLCPLCQLVLANFLFFFRFLVRCFLWYTSGVLIGALHF
jgi:hypothetical protein